MVTKTTELFLLSVNQQYMLIVRHISEKRKNTSIRELNKGWVVSNNVSYVSSTETLSKLSNARIAFSMYNETVRGVYHAVMIY